MSNLTEVFRGKRKTSPGKDILAGIIVAFVSIPISMGYAQIAGLPVIYGLYGSIFPILVFGLITTSSQFVVGIDAMPAAMVGAMLAQMGIVSCSDEAFSMVPLMALLTAFWLILFRVIKAGRIVKYISSPVMGGFMSGVSFTIICMQIPKLFGGNAGTGELFGLIKNVTEQWHLFNPVSASLGFGTVAVILLCKKWIPKFPASVLLMVIGGVLTGVFHIDSFGVKLLPEVSGGMPSFVFPDFSLLKAYPISEILMESLSIALVVMAQTLLATNSYAMKYHEKIDNNQELVGYAAMNIAGALVGCCPANGCVSRTGIAEQYGCRSQIMSLSAAVTMFFVLLFGTELLGYLPVPVLTGIVMAALIGILDFKQERKLWKTDKREWFIFMTAFVGVLLLGTINGVVVGVILSFAAVVIRAVVPPRAFLGLIPGHEDFHSIQRTKGAKPIRGAIIYRFSGNLFFANIDTFQTDIETAICEDTKVVIVDARGVGSIDMTAAERLVSLYHELQGKGIHFYLTEHVGLVNDQLRMFGADELIRKGAVRRTISLALRDAGFEKPYHLAGTDESTNYAYEEASDKLAEFDWVFGEDAEEYLEILAKQNAEKMLENLIQEIDGQTSWGRLGLFDEEEYLEYLEIQLDVLESKGRFGHEKHEEFEKMIEKRRTEIEEKLAKINPKAIEMVIEHHKNIEKRMKDRHPREYAHLEKRWRKIYENLEKDKK